MLEIIQERGCFHMAKGIAFIALCLALGVARKYARG